MESSYTDPKDYEVTVDVPETAADDLAVSLETKVRTILFFITWVNQVFAFVGAPTLDLDFGEVYAVVSSVVTKSYHIKRKYAIT